MHRELNDPGEIKRRLIYVLYLSCWIATVTTGIIGIVQGKFSLICTSGLVAFLAIILKQHGEQSLEFERLGRSFPYGTPEDELPETVRTEMETIFIQFNATEKDWQERLKLRQQLEILVKKNPILLEIYRDEIISIHPMLPNQLRSN